MLTVVKLNLCGGPTSLGLRCCTPLALFSVVMVVILIRSVVLPSSSSCGWWCRFPNLEGGSEASSATPKERECEKQHHQKEEEAKQQHPTKERVFSLMFSFCSNIQKCGPLWIPRHSENKSRKGKSRTKIMNKKNAKQKSKIFISISFNF